MADSALGSYALPAPWEWRCSEGAWRGLALTLGVVGSSNVLLLLHGLLQPTVAATFSRSSLTMLLVAQTAYTPLGGLIALVAPLAAVLTTAALPALAEVRARHAPPPFCTTRTDPCHQPWPCSRFASHPLPHTYSHIIATPPL